MAEHVAKNGQDFETTVRRHWYACYEDMLPPSDDCTVASLLLGHFAGARTPTIRSSNSWRAERALSIIRLWAKGFDSLC